MIEIDISVVIATYNRRNLLEKALESLVNQSYPKDKFEILIVDDGSSDNTGEIVNKLMKLHDYLRYIKTENQGPAKSRNVGINNAGGEIVAFIDDDCLADRDWLKEIMNSFKTQKDAVGIEGKTITYPEEVTPFTYQVVNNGGGYLTCNIAYKKVILDKVGGFDTDYPFPHDEDADLAWSVMQYGKIYFEPKVLVVHPPRHISSVEFIRRARYHESDFRLQHKFPDHYMFRSPLITFSHFMFFTFFKELKEKKSFMKKEPLTYLRYVLVLLLERAYLLLLIPSFYLRHFRAKYD